MTLATTDMRDLLDVSRLTATLTALGQAMQGLAAAGALAQERFESFHAQLARLNRLRYAHRIRRWKAQQARRTRHV